MAITRSATPLLSATELVAIRTRLADHYGSELHEEGEQRILCIHVPHAEPDPVNHVEEAIEYLEPGDVEQATHVLLLGTERIAQVYVEPFRHLMAERVHHDARIAATWSQRLPGTLSHQFFRDPGDPRRRWRLAVRLPVESMADVEDDLLEPLADELGPQLDTPRIRDLAAVYLLTSRDHARLAPDVFLQELLKTWRDEERRRRALAQREREKQQERERKEHERRKLMADLEKTLGRRVAQAPLRRHPGVPLDRIDALPTPDEVLGVEPGTRLRAGRRPDAPEPTQRRADHGPTTGATHAPGPVGGAHASPHQAAHDASPLLWDAEDVIDVAPQVPQGGPVDVEAPLEKHQEHVERIRDKVDVLGRRTRELHDRPGGRLGRMAQHLMDCGFDVLVRPETPGPRIDLAAERPQGDPGRIVLRVEDHLDAITANKALELARTLRVDQVIVVADQADAEAKRKILATKVHWLTPRDLAAARL